VDGTNLVLTARRLRATGRAGPEPCAHRIKFKQKVLSRTCAGVCSPRRFLILRKGWAWPVDLLVNNAGFGPVRRVNEVRSETLLDMVQVNCRAVLHLTRLYLPGMVARARRRCVDRRLNGLIPGGSVPFNLRSDHGVRPVFGGSLAEEMKPHGIRCARLCPGTTPSEFPRSCRPSVEFERSGTIGGNGWRATGLKALAAGKSYVISGLGHYLGAHRRAAGAARLVTRIAAKLFRPPDERARNQGLKRALFALCSPYQQAGEPFFLVGRNTHLKSSEASNPSVMKLLDETVGRAAPNVRYGASSRPFSRFCVYTNAPHRRCIATRCA